MPRYTIFKKILIITLLLSLAPLLVTFTLLLINLHSIGSSLSREISESDDSQASESLKMGHGKWSRIFSISCTSAKAT